MLIFAFLYLVKTENDVYFFNNSTNNGNVTFHGFPLERKDDKTSTRPGQVNKVNAVESAKAKPNNRKPDSQPLTLNGAGSFVNYGTIATVANRFYGSRLDEATVTSTPRYGANMEDYSYGSSETVAAPAATKQSDRMITSTQPSTYKYDE